MPVSLKSLRRAWRYAALLVAGVVAFALLSGNTQANEREDVIVGATRVIDGDSFEVAGTKIRLHGIDAPESDQICQTEQGADWACGGWISRVVKDRYSGEVARCEALELD